MTATPELHPAQNRGLRELVATSRQLADHWGSLATRFEGQPKTAKVLGDGAAAARVLIDSLRPLMEARGLYGGAAAQSVGRSLAGSRSQVGDRFLERNQALRTAVLDVQHVVTLLGYQAAIAEGRGDEELGRELRARGRKLLAVERAARRSVLELGADPDAAIERLDPSPAGAVAHGAANAAGTVGEWVDRKRGES
jgi:hypothetical protein